MRHETVLNRCDGSTVLIVVEGVTDVLTGCTGASMWAVLKKDGKANRYYYPQGISNKSLGGLTVSEYVRRGRKGILAVARPHEIIKAQLEFNELLDT